MVFHLSKTAIIRFFFRMRPYRLGMQSQYTFDTAGTYTFSDPTNTNPAAPKGKINVIAPANAPDNLSTNSTQATAGLFVVQADEKDYFDQHFNTLGYHVEDSYMIPSAKRKRYPGLCLYSEIGKGFYNN